MTIDVRVQPVVDLAAFPLGGRRVVVFEGESFQGRDGLRGTIAAGGVDWQLVRSDGVLEIDAHYLLLSDDDEPIEVRSTGLRKASAAVATRIARGDPVDPSEYYFRVSIQYETSASDYEWLNWVVAVASALRL